MHGGMKIYHGAAAAARHYVEADRSRADEYYLAEGSGVAMRFTATPDGIAGAGWQPHRQVTGERRIYQHEHWKWRGQRQGQVEGSET